MVKRYHRYREKYASVLRSRHCTAQVPGASVTRIKHPVTTQHVIVSREPGPGRLHKSSVMQAAWHPPLFPPVGCNKRPCRNNRIYNISCATVAVRSQCGPSAPGRDNGRLGYSAPGRRFWTRLPLRTVANVHPMSPGPIKDPDTGTDTGTCSAGLPAAQKGKVHQLIRTGRRSLTRLKSPANARIAARPIPQKWSKYPDGFQALGVLKGIAVVRKTHTKNTHSYHTTTQHTLRSHKPTTTRTDFTVCH